MRKHGTGRSQELIQELSSLSLSVAKHQVLTSSTKKNKCTSLVQGLHHHSATVRALAVNQLLGQIKDGQVTHYV